MKREQVAKTIGCTTESLRRWYVEGKKQGLVTKLSKSESKGDGSSDSTKPVGAEAEATSAPHDPGAGLGEHESRRSSTTRRSTQLILVGDHAELHLGGRRIVLVRVEA
ncbi:MAG TPA: hypothetical protein VFD36_19625 [Kofleriaceae bacterium]|nr:hypothetical protein [Kofleriaceae bacterium]